MKYWPANFCIHASKSPVIILNQLKSICSSPFIDLHSHPIHTCYPIFASNGRPLILIFEGGAVSLWYQIPLWDQTPLKGTWESDKKWHHTLILTSSGGHQSGRCASCWNVFFFTHIFTQDKNKSRSMWNLYCLLSFLCDYLVPHG